MLAGCSSAPAVAQNESVPTRVVVEQKGDGWQMLVGGKPFFVKGSGGDGSLDRLKATGANALRTWGSDKLDMILPEARKRDLMVCAGIWLGHREQSFNYDNPDQVAKQQESVRQTILKYKNDPNVLVWALGNEMEGYGKGDDAAIWTAVENAAKLAKQLDPNHPTMTVIAEIGGDRVKSIHTLCPDIDIIGINSYGGSPSIAERYKAAGGKKPYIITEFGPPGTWEGPKTAWGAPIELTSTEKAGRFREAYEKSIANQPLCLGSFAFVWGHKQEGTSTWNGLLLPDGSKVAAVDTLHELWTGKPPADPCPVIKTLTLNGAADVTPGATIKAILDASDPSGAPVKAIWTLRDEDLFQNVGGVHEETLPSYPEAIIQASANGAEVRLPTRPGKYRLYVEVENDKGGAATANIPLFAKKSEAGLEPAATAHLPLNLYVDGGQGGAPFVPAGWMGDAKAIAIDDRYSAKPHSGFSSMQCKFDKADGWGGVVWQDPANDWGDKAGGRNLTGAKRLTFWARGDKGGEKVSFQFGLIGMDKKYSDSAQGKLEGVILTPDWKQYAIDLAGKDLSRIKTGFCWVVAGQGAPITFYLDDIRYE